MVIGLQLLEKLGFYQPIDYEHKRFERLAKRCNEIDGHDSHKTKEQRTADYKRERHLKRRGWRFIRFTGTDVYTDPQGCVRDVLTIVRGYNDL